MTLGQTALIGYGFLALLLGYGVGFVTSAVLKFVNGLFNFSE